MSVYIPSLYFLLLIPPFFFLFPLALHMSFPLPFSLFPFPSAAYNVYVASHTVPIPPHLERAHAAFAHTPRQRDHSDHWSAVSSFSFVRSFITYVTVRGTSQWSTGLPLELSLSGLYFANLLFSLGGCTRWMAGTQYVCVSPLAKHSGTL